ncbi:MAG: hypothetical protein N2745_12005 [Syntrophorhabdaceae bacterium]|nr:hypothetical protein [Syntrophorhabdaceae bacterium]
MKPLKKIEIVVDSVETEEILKILDEAGITGYTVIKDVFGKGERGQRDGQGLTSVFWNNYIITACPEELMLKVVEAIRPILKRFGGVCLVSDTYWVIH